MIGFPHIHRFHDVQLFGHRPLGLSMLGLPLVSERTLQRCRCGETRQHTRKVWTTEDQFRKLEWMYGVVCGRGRGGYRPPSRRTRCLTLAPARATK